MARVQRLHGLARRRQLLLDRARGEGAGHLTGVVGAHQDALGAVQVVAGVPQQPRFVVDIREAAVDLVFAFPEPRGLPCHLVGQVRLGLGDGGLGGAAEVVVDFGQQWQGNGDDGVVGVLDLGLATAPVAPGHLAAAIARTNRLHFGVQLHPVLHLGVQRLGDLVHATDGLEHGGGEFRDFVEHQRQHQVGVEQPLQRHRLALDRCLLAGPGKAGVAGAYRALVMALFVEVAVYLQEVQQGLLVSAVQFLVQRLAADAARQQFAQMPAGVVDRLAQQQRRLRQVGLGKGVAAAVDQHFQWHVQLPAVTEDGQVMAGQPRGAGVEVIAIVETHRLAAAVVVHHLVAVAQRPGPPADTLAGFQHPHLEPGLAQFVGCHQAADASAHHQHAFAVASAGGQPQRREGAGLGNAGQQAQGGQAAKGGTVATGGHQVRNKVSAG
ncbi:hypothetical protein D3C76_914550 [compost metagenome]